MKSFILLLMLLANCPAFAQNGEFATENDLIYSDTAIRKLKHIVDSLNLKFKVCQSKNYYTTRQGGGVYVEVLGANAFVAKEDLDSNLSLEDFLKKYPEAIVQNNFIGICHTYKDYNGKDIIYIELLNLDPNNDVGIEFKDENYSKFINKDIGWFYTFNAATDYSRAKTKGFYFYNTIKRKPLNEKFSRMIQYSECLIDTTTQVYLEGATRSYSFGSIDDKNISKVITYINKKLKRPSYEESMQEINYGNLADSITLDTLTSIHDVRFESYMQKMVVWEKIRLQRVDSLMKFDKKFKKMFDSAADDIITGKTPGNDEMEEYIARYISKEQALFLKRLRRVVGSCSMDNSPRIHAMEIAELAAETTKWEIFLRSHLDIMNDRFDRMSDGSYAWAGRKTYIKELEVLDINVNDLLLGIILKVDNPSENHYYGSITRIGRSLSEAGNKQEIEAEMLSMIADPELDMYNKIIIYYLFLNYNYNLADIHLQSLNSKKLQQAVATMPNNILASLPAERK